MERIKSQTYFNEYFASEGAYDYEELSQLTIITGQGTSCYRIGSDGVTRIIATLAQYKENEYMDRYLIFIGEFLLAEIVGTPTVEKRFLK